MLRRKQHRDGTDHRPKSSLGSVKIEEYYGDRSRYIKWKRAIEAQQHLYVLSEGELSMLIYLSTRKEARDVVEQHPINSYTGGGGLQLLWKVLDEAFGESEAELFERADKELERCRRQPGESVAHFLAEMRRLRAQYYRIDPDSRISDKAWGQKLLQKASLSRRERLDCYYAAGASYDSLEIEKALRVRCGRIHEEEKRVSQPRERTSDGYRNSGGNYGYTKKKVFVKRKVNHTHVEQGVDEGEDCDEMECIEEENALDETMEPEDSAEDQLSSVEDVDEEELKEVFAAGWKAKQKTAEVRKSRGWKKPDQRGAKGGSQSTDARKKVTTCASCGKVGHWKGDAECPNVQSGQDPPHQKKVNEVHFTFMVGGPGGGGPPEIPPGHCHHCRWVLAPTARFCQQCGVPVVDQDQRMSRVKRERRSEEEDRWDVVDPPEPFTFSVPKERVKDALGGGSRASRTSEADQVRLTPRGLISTLPEMSREEKKRLKEALRQDEECEAWRSLEKHRVLLQEIHQDLHEDMTGYHRTPMSGVSRGSDDQRPLIPRPKPLLQPPKGDKPRPVKERELQEFREALIARQWKDGKLRPSEASPMPTETQARCCHPPDRLRWTANGEGHQARCRVCDLKNVIYFSTRHGVLMVSSEDAQGGDPSELAEDAEKVRRMVHTPPSPAPSNVRVKVKYERNCTTFRDLSFEEIGVHELHCRITKNLDGEVIELMRGRLEGKMNGPVPGGPKHLVTEFWYTPAQQAYDSLGVFIEGGSPGLAIADSGCRNAVGGLWWHNAFQNYLRERKLPFERLEEREVYRFGAGEPVVSTVAYIYPVGVHGKPDVVRISVVEKEAIACPGLIGPSELQRWNAVFKFATKEMQLQDVVKPMKLTSTRHPGIDLTDAPELVLQRFWHSEEGQNRRRKLVYDPQSLAFVASQAREDSDSGSEEHANEESSDDNAIWGDPDEYEALQERRKRKWLSQLEDELEQSISAVEPEDQCGEEEAAESEDTVTDDPSEPTEESSHEQGVELLSEASEDEEDMRRDARDRENEVYWMASEKKIMNKGLKRKLGHHVKEIKESFQQEKSTEVKRGRKKDPGEGPGTAKTRRSRPFSVLEVFTWTCAISIMAASRGWIAHEPVTLPGWDLMKDADYKEALDYIDRVSPDLLVIAWPCTKWSRLQTLGAKSPLQLARLATARKRQRKLLRFTRDAATRQRRRKKLVLGENPATSLAWKEPLIEEAFDGLSHEITDMCQYNLRVPEKGLLRKRTRLAGQQGLMRHCVRKCQCKKKHVPVLGSAKINGQWRSVSDFAGGYTMEFAEAVIRGAEETLEEGEAVEEALVAGEGVPEETWQDDDEIEGEADGGDEAEITEDVEKIKKGSVKWKIRALHQRLGHPTKATLRRMLVLSGASKEVIHEAENYDCPICLETAMPGRYLKQRAEIRPVTFGKELHCDLKYIHDHNNKLFVALSVVDAATSFHMAVLLRSRSASHVARKFQRHWCSLYGCPEDIIMDQGGEFDGAFVAWLEAHGIHSKVTGARSAWQHGYAERHGALLGTMCTSLIWQYHAKGASQVKDCLCAAIQAKNMTLTRKGYTPFQMVFGRSPLFPRFVGGGHFGQHGSPRLTDYGRRGEPCCRDEGRGTSCAAETGRSAEIEESVDPCSKR